MQFIFCPETLNNKLLREIKILCRLPNKSSFSSSLLGVCWKTILLENNGAVIRNVRADQPQVLLLTTTETHKAITKSVKTANNWFDLRPNGRLENKKTGQPSYQLQPPHMILLNQLNISLYITNSYFYLETWFSTTAYNSSLSDTKVFFKVHQETNRPSAQIIEIRNHNFVDPLTHAQQSHPLRTMAYDLLHRLSSSSVSH